VTRPGVDLNPAFNRENTESLLFTVELRFNEPLYNEVLGITNDIFQPSNGAMYGKEPRYNEPFSPVPLHFVKVFRYSFFGTIPNFLNRLLDSPFLVRSK